MKSGPTTPMKKQTYCSKILSLYLTVVTVPLSKKWRCVWLYIQHDACPDHQASAAKRFISRTLKSRQQVHGSCHMKVRRKSLSRLIRAHRSMLQSLLSLHHFKWTFRFSKLCGTQTTFSCKQPSFIKSSGSNQRRNLGSCGPTTQNRAESQ
ncbi:hypothetical protein TNCV_3085601 [Trichonephila clavipes]|nr:hypothetical protein TNCV_3085601 [Trichonephila clavipes]